MGRTLRTHPSVIMLQLGWGGGALTVACWATVMGGAGPPRRMGAGQPRARAGTPRHGGRPHRQVGGNHPPLLASWQQARGEWCQARSTQAESMAMLTLSCLLASSPHAPASFGPGRPSRGRVGRAGQQPHPITEGQHHPRVSRNTPPGSGDHIGSWRQASATPSIQYACPPG